MDEPNEQQEQTVETTEEVPATTETTSEATTEAPPWGDDFDAQRAWDTITNLRSEVKEVKQGSQEREQAQQEALAWRILASSEDEDQRQAAAEYLDIELPDEEDTDPDEYEDPHEQRLSKLEQAQNAQAEAEAQKEFDSHLSELAKGAEVELTKRDRAVLLDASTELGFNPEATEKAFKEFLEERKDYDKAVIDGYVKGKKSAPHVSPVGSNANEVPDLDDRNERVRWITEQYQQGRQQT